MKNWKTTASGIVLAILVFAKGSGFDLPTWASKSLNGLECVGIICLGMSAKDFDVNGRG